MVFGGVADTGPPVRLLRARSKATLIYAGPAAARTAFRALAGTASEGVRCPQMTTAAASEEGTIRRACLLRRGTTSGRGHPHGWIEPHPDLQGLARLSPWQGRSGEIRLERSKPQLTARVGRDHSQCPVGGL